MSRTKRSRRTKRSKRAKRTMRKVRGRRCWSGGANQLVFPAPVANESYESSLSSPSKMMLAQGNDYQSIHQGQHGGAYAANPAPAPVGDTGMLPAELRGQAAITPLDQSTEAASGMSDMKGGAYAGNPAPAPPGYAGTLAPELAGQAFMKPLNDSLQAIQGMSDMAGGRRKRSKKGSRGRSRRGRSRRGRSRRMRGGAGYQSNPQDFGAPGMLLSPSQEATALTGMNPEWKLATDPSSFAPTLSSMSK
jgi:hypothetical protein